mmetsp:Transcript_109628/g.210837  ORF Transcript_109628/g.210837 Transcript_109628/m.210837 type:complete len:1161 (-) Transcript_109628:52-3534(-)
MAMEAGNLVEIVNLSKPVRCKVARLPDFKGSVAEYTALDPGELDGKIGVCMEVDDDAQICVVRTFDNVIAEIPSESLRDYFPPDAMEGGFDLVWPADGEVSLAFGSAINSVLGFKGYCMIQMFMNEADATQMVDDTENIPRQYRMKREVETAYLGLESTTKVAIRPHDTPVVRVMDAMTSSDRCLTNVTLALGALPVEEVGFKAKSRTNAFLRVPYSNESEKGEVTPESLQTIQDVKEWDLDVKGLLKFSQARTISMIHFVQNDGGEIFLYPRETQMRESIRLPVSSNKLLLFRHDFLDYSYQPLGRSLAMQAWINKELERTQKVKNVEIDFTSGVATLNPGRAVPEGIPAHVLSLHAKMPMNVENEWGWWCEFAFATDAVTKWPETRWDTEPYYMEGDEAMNKGLSYTKHGGFTSFSQITNFDNSFFDIDEKEFTFMLPSQKWCCEVGYLTLMKAGYNRHTLEGEPIGVWMGDVGPDWHTGQNFWMTHFGGEDDGGMTGPEAAIMVHSAITAARLPYIYGFRGPTSTYDTACSASLVAMNAAHTFMMNFEDEEMYGNMALVMGVNTLLWPASYIGNCAAGMLSHVGRSFTFNRSADGYQRGEGCAGVFLQRDCTEEMIQNRQGAIIGTATNQDGRSASITAPNGPAQTAAIKKSMAFAGIDVNTVGGAECHGTGTALGDPIEVGALQAVMRVRTEPILKVSTKSHTGHLEAGAGTAGLTKCLMMIRFSVSPSNCHFNIINPNLMTQGYPVFFTNEDTDYGHSSGYCGVSSFGFGGTNSRCDVYNQADRGPRKTERVLMPVPALPARTFEDFSHINICGTWNQWLSDSMELESGAHIYRMTLGQTCVERFRLEAADNTFLYPAVQMACQDDQVLGPDLNANGRAWVIDGRKDGMPAGTVYEIKFEHSGGVKRISWTPVAVNADEEVMDAFGTHTMYITGSFNNWKLQPMQPVMQTSGTYECQFQMGPWHKDDFQFLIDKDMEQLIYPGKDDAVCGPDGSGSKSKFSVSGPQFQTATVRLTFRDGRITVTSHTERQGTKAWGAKYEISETHSYFLITSNDLYTVMHPMKADEKNPGVFRVLTTLDRGDTSGGGFNLIQFNIDQDKSRTLFPNKAGVLQGPEPDEEGRYWKITGVRYSTYEVTLDVNAASRASMVSWQPVRK